MDEQIIVGRKGSLLKIENPNGIAVFLRDEDIRPVRDLINSLRTVVKPSIEFYLSGGALAARRKDYGDIDLLTLAREDEDRLRVAQVLSDDSYRVMTARGVGSPAIQFGKSHYLVTPNGDARRYLHTEIDESFLLEPFRESPCMGVVAMGSPIELCLTSTQNFQRDYLR